VVLQTDWYAQPEHGGFYEAQQDGGYKAVGLDVEIRQGHPGLIPPQQVAAGAADFAIARSDDVILAVSHGLPLVMVGALMERDPQGIMVHSASGITRFQDLNGRRLMAVPGTPFVSILEKKYGIHLAVTPTDFGISRFMADPGLSTQCFVTNEPFYAREQGAKVGVLLLSDCGFSPYRVWFTRRSLIKEHPDVVRAFTVASVAGWKHYLEGDRSLADARLIALNPRMNAKFIGFSVGAMREYRLVAGDPAAGEAIGRLDRARIAQQISQLQESGNLDHPVSVDEVMDAEFLPRDMK